MATGFKIEAVLVLRVLQSLADSCNDRSIQLTVLCSAGGFRVSDSRKMMELEFYGCMMNMSGMQPRLAAFDWY